MLLLLESCRNRFDDIMMAAESMQHSLRFTSHYDYRDHQSPAYTVNNFALLHFFSLIDLPTQMDRENCTPALLWCKMAFFKRV